MSKMAFFSKFLLLLVFYIFRIGSFSFRTSIFIIKILEDVCSWAIFISKVCLEIFYLLN